MLDRELNLLKPVIIVEDEPLIQIRLKQILFQLGYMAEDLYFAQNIAIANTLVNKHPVAFALVDLGLPDGNGIEFIQRLKQHNADIPILVISAWSFDEMILDALQSGATGYLLKERDDIEILLSIRNIFRGGAPIDPFIAHKILHLIAAKKTQIPEQPKSDQPQQCFTKREIEILNQVAQGLSNKEIAAHLNLSKYTVESHIKNIYQKLSVHNRTEAVDTARQLGFLHTSQSSK